MRKLAKFYTLVMAVAVAMSLMALPANACTTDGQYDDVIPCDKVVKDGYCDERYVFYQTGEKDGRKVFSYKENPYYAKPGETPKPIETPVTTPASSTDEKQPEFPLADVAVPVTIEVGRPWEWVTYDAVRITHVVDQETVMYEGEPMELYTIYPGARVWKTKTDTDSTMKIFKATLENGTLTAGELDFAFEVEEPLTHLGYLYWDEEEAGNYYIAEIIDTCFDKKIGIRVVEGSRPKNVPTYYVYDVAFSETATYNEERNIFTVPMGTVVTVPYDTAGGYASHGLAGHTAVWAETDPSDVELYMCNGRESFKVEPGRIYHVNYIKNAFFTIEGIVEDGINEAHIYIMAEDSGPSQTASPSTQTVNVDGKPVEFAMYALNDGSTNYIRVRDLAAVLNGTSAQFNVGWNGNVTLTSKTSYDGATDKAPFATPMAYTEYTNPTYVDGKAVDLEAIQIEYNGGGFTYYKLRDLAQALNFNVGWSADKGIFVETNKPYDPNN